LPHLAIWAFCGRASNKITRYLPLAADIFAADIQINKACWIFKARRAFEPIQFASGVQKLVDSDQTPLSAVCTKGINLPVSLI